MNAVTMNIFGLNSIKDELIEACRVETANRNDVQTNVLFSIRFSRDNQTVLGSLALNYAKLEL